MEETGFSYNQPLLTGQALREVCYTFPSCFVNHSVTLVLTRKKVLGRKVLVLGNM